MDLVLDLIAITDSSPLSLDPHLPKTFNSILPIRQVSMEALDIIKKISKASLQ